MARFPHRKEFPLDRARRSEFSVGGQLGRMFGIAARRMGYRVHAFEPHPDSPAGQISDVEVNAPYADSEALKRVRPPGRCDLLRVREHSAFGDQGGGAPAPLRPRGEVLHICQNREREKGVPGEAGLSSRRFRGRRISGESARGAGSHWNAVSSQDGGFWIRRERPVEVGGGL